MRRVLKHKHIPITLIMAILLVLILSSTKSFALEGPINKNVLVIHQLSEAYIYHQLFNKGLIEALDKDSRYNFNYSYEYLNMDKYSDNEEYLKATAEYLELKHINSNKKPDIIFASDGVADFLYKYGKNLFIDVPIVTIWAGEGSAPSDILAKNFVISAPPNYHENIFIIQKAQENVKKLYVVIGDSKGERYALEQIKKAAEKYNDRIEFIYLNKLPYLEMLETLRGAEDGSAVLFVRWLIDVEEQSFLPANVVKNIIKETRVPVYGTQIQYLGNGIVGGYLYDNALIGKKAASIGVSLISGDEIGNLLITDSQFHQYAFDSRAIERWAIDSNKLPKKSKIEYIEEDLWDIYGKYVLLGGIIILFQAALILGLITSWRKQRKAEKELIVLNVSLENLVDDRTQELQEAKGKLEELNKRLTSLSITDPLTNLYNRRYMEDRLNQEYEEFIRTGNGFTIMLADIDDFKKVNDLHGHDIGDMVLKKSASKIRDMMRGYDVVSRWGGEEFLMLFPNLMNGYSETRAEAIRKSIEEDVYSNNCDDFSITITIGVATIKNKETIEEVIKRADIALYQGKRTGKNRVVMAV